MKNRIRTLRMAGVPVDLEIYKGVVHGFITMGRVMREAYAAVGVCADALKRYLHVARP